MVELRLIDIKSSSTAKEDSKDESEVTKENPCGKWLKRREEVEQRDIPTIEAMDIEDDVEVVWNEVRFSERKYFKVRDENIDDLIVEKTLNLLEQFRSENASTLLQRKKEELESRMQSLEIDHQSTKAKRSQLLAKINVNIMKSQPPTVPDLATPTSLDKIVSPEAGEVQLPKQDSEEMDHVQTENETPSTSQVVVDQYEKKDDDQHNVQAPQLSTQDSEEMDHVQIENETPTSQVVDDQYEKKGDQHNVQAPQSSKQVDEFVNSSIFCNDLENSVKSFVNDGKFKIYRNDLQLFIRTTINSISGNSISEVKTKSNQLVQLLTNTSINFQGKQLDCCKHPDALNFCLIFAAKTFISSGAVQVSSISAAAFPVGAVIAIIWSKLPTFGKLFLGFLSEKCPFVKPKGPEKGDINTQIDETYLKRYRALLMIYGAVITTSIAKNHPHDLRHGWIWLSSKLKCKPCPTITAAILQAFLQTTAYKMSRFYKKQFFKILIFINNIYLPMIAKVTGDDYVKQSLIKLELFVKETIDRLKASGRIDQPTGYIEHIFY